MCFLKQKNKRHKQIEEESKFIWYTDVDILLIIITINQVLGQWETLRNNMDGTQ